MINDNRYRIHETVLRDILDIMMDLKDHDEIEILTNKNKVFKSSASAAKDLTLVFPVICSKSVSIENASMVAKAIERKAATLLQLLFTAHSITDKENGIDFIKQFHTNINFSSDRMTIDGVIDTIDRIASMDENTIELPLDAIQRLERAVKEEGIVLPESVNPSSLMEFKVTPETDPRGRTVVQEAPSASFKTSGTGDVRNIATAMSDFNKAQNATWLTTDVKKANELVPTMMVVNFFVKDSSNEASAIGFILVGVKAKLYPVDSQDMLNHIVSKVADTNWFNSLIRATTREISFWKDFIFAIDKAKIDALSNSRRGSSSKMWKVLERRALKSKIRRGTATINDALAISNLVISQEEVELLKKFNNIDIENSRIAAALMEAYNLMSITIVDEAMEICKFIFDTGDDTYESMSFSLLEREASDNTYKKIVNLMTKTAR